MFKEGINGEFFCFTRVENRVVAVRLGKSRDTLE
jgi:hypothetical protein